MISRTIEFEQKVKDRLAQCDVSQLTMKEQGMLLSAVSKLYQATDDTFFMDYVYQTLDKMTTEDGDVKAFDECKGLERYILANVYFFIHKIEKMNHEDEDNKFKKAILKMANALKDQPRNNTDIFVGTKGDDARLADVYATQVFYMNYESQFGGKEKYNDIIAQFNCIHESLYQKNNCANEANMLYLCALIDTMEVMEQPLYEIYHRLQDLLKEGVKDLLAEQKDSLMNLDTESGLYAVYAILKACRMKALHTEKYEAYGEEVLLDALNNCASLFDKTADKESDTAVTALIMAYAEGVRNRAYQDYGRNKGGILWS